MFQLKRKVSLTIFTKILSLLFAIFILQAVFNYAFIYESEFKQITNELTTLNNRIQNDIKYDKGSWNVNAYAADPLTPNPTGASGFSTNLYVITRDGLVIERNNPIYGLLDASDYKKLLSYQIPQTITTSTKEQWRVFAQPIISEGKTTGVVFVSYRDPGNINFSEVDEELIDTSKKIVSQITFKGDQIDVGNVDKRQLQYNISFEVVDAYNKVVLNNGRTPTSIDPSYFVDELNKKTTRQVIDEHAHIPYLVTHQLITDTTGNVVGIIVSGKSTAAAQLLLKDYLFFTTVTSAFLVLLILFSLFYSFRKELSHLIELHAHHHPTTPKSIHFNAKKGELKIDNQLFVFPLETNQYYLCVAVFSSPSKPKSEKDLLKLFGEKASKANWRKVYDASLSINKKVRLKLISYQDRSYKINSEFQKYIV